MYQLVIKLKDFLVKRSSVLSYVDSTSIKVRGPASKLLRSEMDNAVSIQKNARGETLNSAETGGKPLTDTNESGFPPPCTFKIFSQTKDSRSRIQEICNSHSFLQDLTFSKGF